MVGREEFEAALRESEVLLEAADVTIQSTAKTQAVSITGEPEVPDFDPDRELIWTVDGSAARFDLSELLAKPEVADDTALSSDNAIVQWVGSKLFMLARSTDSPSQFLFSSDHAGTYSVEITVSSIDIEPWARRSNAATIPAAKLPSPTDVGDEYNYTLDNNNWVDTGLTIPDKEWLLLSLKDFQRGSGGVGEGRITSYSNEVFVRIADLIDTPLTAGTNRYTSSTSTLHGVVVNFASDSQDAGQLHFGATSNRNLLIARHDVGQQGTLRVRSL